MLPEPVPRLWDTEACRWSERWGISTDLAIRLQAMQMRLGLPLSIRSGFRTEEEQNELRRAGRPTASNDTSNHLTCPATAADLDVHGITPVVAVKWAFGAAARASGLRWGGGSPQDENGMPSDWNHVDLGPRR